MDGSMRPVIVIPGDEPIQLTGSPHLERLEAVGDVRLFGDRPGTDADKISRAADAEILINSRSIVKCCGSSLCAASVPTPWIWRRRDKWVSWSRTFLVRRRRWWLSTRSG